MNRTALYSGAGRSELQAVENLQHPEAAGHPSERCGSGGCRFLRLDGVPTARNGGSAFPDELRSGPLQPEPGHDPGWVYPGSSISSMHRDSRAITEEETKTKSIPAFLSSSDDEVDINVRNVAIEDLRAAPYKAALDFEKVYRTANDHREVRRERFVAHFLFSVLDKVPNNFVPVNPLGLVITYFREDQAF